MMDIEKNDNQFLTFYVADEIYALSVLNIKEIIEYSKVTKVPLMDRCISGITNIRGSVIPLINLGIRMNTSKDETINKRTSIIVIEKEDKVKNFQVGLIVDEVNKVYDILNQEQEDAPTFGSKIRKEFIEHIAKINGTFIPILNSSQIVNIDELSQIVDTKEV
jgi:purine-binding chemotaxis protein CheW